MKQIACEFDTKSVGLVFIFKNSRVERVGGVYTKKKRMVKIGVAIQLNKLNENYTIE